MAKKTFELIRSKSLTDYAYAEYEYLIRWIGRDGSDYVYLFEDAEVETKIQNETINAENTSRIEAIVEKISRQVTLQADDLSLSDTEVIEQLFENKFVQRIKKDGTIERMAPAENSYSKRIRDGRYSVGFALIRTDLRHFM